MRNQLKEGDDFYLRFLKIHLLMRQYYRKENQSRLIEKICNLKRIFDHK